MLGRLPKSGAYTHPGEMLEEEFLKPLGISQSRLARHIDVNPRVVNEICRGKRGISVRMAQLLEAALGMDADFWLRLQMMYDLSVNRIKKSERPKRLPEAIHAA